MNFLSLVNDLCKAFNEVELTASNFNSAVGIYAHFKDGVNAALREINQQKFEWPFNHETKEIVLVPGQVRYALPEDMKTVDWEVFRIKRDNTINVATKKLKTLTYDEYLEKYLDNEYNDSSKSMPDFVFRTPDLKFGVTPTPDKEYTVVYEYYKLPEDLVAHDDEPTVPKMFRNIIFQGASVYGHIFRGDTEEANRAQGRFEDLMKDMRSIYINRYEYARSTMRS